MARLLDGTTRRRRGCMGEELRDEDGGELTRRSNTGQTL